MRRLGESVTVPLRTTRPQTAEADHPTPDVLERLDVSSDTGVLAEILSNATGSAISSYLKEELWQSVGMEGNAYWSTDRSGAEIGFCCLNARLLRYLRLGRLYLEDGMREGAQILPDGGWRH